MDRRRLLVAGAAGAGMVAAGLAGCGGGGSGGGSSSSSSSSSSRVITSYAGQADFTVGQTSVDEQGLVAVAALANGDFAMAWLDSTLVAPGNYQSNVRVKIFTATGSVRTSDFVASTVRQGLQMRPAIGGLTGGDFVVAWEDGSPYVKAQVFSATGAAKGPLISVNTSASRMQWSVAVAGLGDGGFVVAWLEDDVNFWSNPAQQHIVRGQVFTAAGAKSGSEFQIASQVTVDGFTVRVAGLSNGNIAATWDGIGVQTAVFNTSGQPVSPAYSMAAVNPTAPAPAGVVHGVPAIAGLVKGGYVVVWRDSTGGPIAGQLFTNTGAANGALFVVSSGNANPPDAPAVTALANGQFVVTWNDDSGDSFGDLSGLRGRVYTADGQTFGNEFAVNGSLAGTQINGAVAGLKNGDFVAAWNDKTSNAGHFNPKARIFVGQ